MPPTVVLFRVLQVSAAVCFIGHGVFGFITKEDWIPFFAVVGIPADWGWRLQPLIGAVDVFAGVFLLVRPTKFCLVYMTGWALWTAALRPLDGRSIWEFFERAGNYGVPFALLTIAVATYPRSEAWLRKLEPRPLNPQLVDRLIVILKLTVAALLIGHAGFAIFLQKEMLLDHLASVGLGDGSPDSLPILLVQGYVETGLALAVLLPLRHGFLSSGLLLFVFGWKVATELMYPFSGDYVFEFVERAGSYGAPIALLILLSLRHRRGENG